MPASSSSTTTSSDASACVVLDTAPEDDTAISAYFDGGGGAAANFSWPVAEATKSKLAEAYQLRKLCDECGVPRVYKPVPAGARAACSAPPPGGVQICVYADALRRCGMRLPLHRFHAAVLRHYGLAPSQLVPYAWSYMAAFMLLCKDAGVEPQVALFRHFFSLCARSLGWYTFRPYTTPGSSAPLFTNSKSRTKYPDWKSRFFFLQAPAAVAPWPFPVKWGKPTREAVQRPQVATAAIKEAAKALLARAGSSGVEVVAFLAAHSGLPVGRHPNLAPASVKQEPPSSSSRKRKSPEPPLVQSPSAASTPPAPPPPMGVGHSATPSFLHLAQMCDAELQACKQELLDTRGGMAELAEELRQATIKKEADAARFRDEHAAAVARHEEELRRAKVNHEADAARLREDHAADLAQVKGQSVSDLMSLKHQNMVREQESYVSGMRDMRKLVLTKYPGVVLPSKLKHVLLPESDDHEFPPQAPAKD